MVSSFISDFWYEDLYNHKKIWFRVDEKIEKSCKFEDGSWWFCARLDYKVLKIKYLNVDPEYEFVYKWVRQIPTIIKVNYIYI